MIYIVTDENKKYIYDGYMFSIEWDVETQDYIVVVRIPSNGKITFINGSKSIEYLVVDNNVIIDNDTLNKNSGRTNGLKLGG